MSYIKVENLSFSYGSRNILSDINLYAGDGEFLSILGCNGVGKSTLFKCILNLLTDYSGTVVADGKDLKLLSRREISCLIAYIPQTCSPVFNFSVEDMVLFGTTSNIGQLSSPGNHERELAYNALKKLGIEQYRDRCFHHLSGGEKQLVIIARAIAQNAKILMLDEPTSSLDFGNQTRVLKQIRALADEGYTIIQTTHSPEQSYLYSDRIVAIKDGRILIDGTPEEVMTKQTMSSIYGIDTEINSLYDDRIRICTATF